MNSPDTPTTVAGAIVRAWTDPNRDWTTTPAGYLVPDDLDDDPSLWTGEPMQEGPRCVRCGDTGVVRYDGYGRRLPEDEPCPDCCGTTSA